MDWARSVTINPPGAAHTPAPGGNHPIAVIGCEAAYRTLEASGFAPRPLPSAIWTDGAVHEAPAAGLLVLEVEAAQRAGRQLGPLLRTLRDAAPLAEVCVWAPDGKGPLVREALVNGATDVILDADPRVLVQALEACLRQAPAPREEPREPIEFQGLISRSPAMARLFETCRRIAPTEATVLLLGETGTGKELLARAVHRLSERPGRFVALNCGAVPESLIDSELFGHEKGSFTGATGAKPGLFRHAQKGTLLLDEVGDLPPSAQLSLLRVLQEGSVRPVGGNEELPIDVRVIAATSVPLYQKVEEGSFREDLLYRLDVIRLVLPPLRDRREDVTQLFEHFTAKLAVQHGVEVPQLSPGFLEAMRVYPWPGNVRQLENFTERLLLTRPASCLTARHFRELVRPYRGERGRAGAGPAGSARPGLDASALSEPEQLPEADVSRTLDEFLVPVNTELERRYLFAALRKNEGRLQATATTAGLSRRTLQRKLKKHGIDRRAFR